MIEQDLAPAESDGGGASDVSAAVRGADRVVSVHGGTYLLPTIVRCDADHALANREFLFPFASVVEVSADRLARLPRPVPRRHLHLERPCVLRPAS